MRQSNHTKATFFSFCFQVFSQAGPQPQRVFCLDPMRKYEPSQLTATNWPRTNWPRNQRFRYMFFVTDFVAVISSQSEGLGKMALGDSKNIFRIALLSQSALFAVSCRGPWEIGVKCLSPVCDILTRDNSVRESWRQGHPNARGILTPTSSKLSHSAFFFVFLLFSFLFSALRFFLKTFNVRLQWRTYNIFR